MFQSVLSHSHINISTKRKKVAAKVQEKSSPGTGLLPTCSPCKAPAAQAAAVNRKEPGGAEIGMGDE